VTKKPTRLQQLDAIRQAVEGHARTMLDDAERGGSPLVAECLRQNGWRLLTLVQADQPRPRRPAADPDPQ
jgi:hypothetical protein